MSIKYVLAPNGIMGVVTKSIGAYVQMWPSGALGASTQPTTGWTNGDIQLSTGANQLILWPIFTSGAGTTECDLKVEFAPDPNGQWFQEPVAINIGAGKLSYIGNTRIVPSGDPVTMLVPFLADYVRISAKVLGSAAGSLLSINATIASVM